MIPNKHFYMIRHGQTEANAAQIMAGSIDSPLTILGRRQAKYAQEALNSLEVKPTLIVHSHLSRARETAEILNEKLDVDMIEDADIAEMHAGDWEGKPYDMVRPLFDGWPIVPNAETPQQFFDRVKRGKMNALNKDNGPILIVCHGGVMRAFGEIHNISTPGKFKNAHLYDFRPNTDQRFPWDVFHFDVCETTKKVTREKSDIYSSNLI